MISERQTIEATAVSFRELLRVRQELFCPMVLSGKNQDESRKEYYYGMPVQHF
jgi:hypothetical protein